MQFRDEKRTCVVIATGPSAGAVPVHTTRGWPTICVNDGYRLRPDADAVYSGDQRWWKFHAETVARATTAQRWCCDERTARELGINWIRFERKPGLSRDPSVIRIGGPVGNSGAQAINLAYLWGARRLVLVGFDMGAQGHFFGDHPKALRTVSPWKTMIAGMSAMASELHAAGVEVLNCSPLTAIRYWPVARLKDALHVAQ